MYKLTEYEKIRNWMKESRNLAGPVLSIKDPTVVETVIQAGPDLLIADMEHSLIDVESLQLICMAAGPVPVFARIRGLEKNEIKKVLDTGVAGIIVPGIEGADEARLAVEASRIAPEGKRGVGPGRASGYGRNISEYIQGKPIVFVQIETRSAFESVEKIAEVHGLDGLFIGPFDLSISLQIRYSWHNPDFVRTVDRVLEESRKNNLLTGIYSPMSAESLMSVRKMEFNFIMLGLDRETIVSGYTVAIQTLKQ